MPLGCAHDSLRLSLASSSRPPRRCRPAASRGHQERHHARSSPKAGATVPAGKCADLQDAASRARARSGSTSASPRRRTRDGVICTDESIGRAKKKGSIFQRTSRSSSTSPSSGSTAPAPTTGRRTGSTARAARRLPPGGPDRQVQGRVAAVTRPVHIGCSGWQYRDWREALLPAAAAAAALARALRDAVRHRRGQQHLLPAGQARGGRALGPETPPGFVFTVKASRYMTHIKRLPTWTESLARYYEAIAPLAESPKLGPVLWQLPGELPARRGPARRRAGAPPAGPPRFEFRHESWFTPRRVRDPARVRRRAGLRRPPASGPGSRSS